MSANTVRADVPFEVKTWAVEAFTVEVRLDWRDGVNLRLSYADDYGWTCDATDDIGDEIMVDHLARLLGFPDKEHLATALTEDLFVPDYRTASLIVGVRQ